MFEVIIENIVKIVFAVVLAAISIGGQAITDQLKNKLKLRKSRLPSRSLCTWLDRLCVSSSRLL